VRLSEADRLVVSALIPSAEELTDRASGFAPGLSPGEPLDAGDLAWVIMIESL
jgi:hypothetical protein